MTGTMKIIRTLAIHVTIAIAEPQGGLFGPKGSTAGEGSGKGREA